jgi:hypothetical protein
MWTKCEDGVWVKLGVEDKTLIKKNGKTNKQNTYHWIRVNNILLLDFFFWNEKRGLDKVKKKMNLKGNNKTYSSFVTPFLFEVFTP